MATIPLNFSWVIDGTLAGCARPYSARDLAFLVSQGIRAVVRLTTPEEGTLDRDAVTAAGLEDLHEPIRVLTTPADAQLERILEFIDGCLKQGKPVAISCGAGYGRTGTVLACYLVHRGWSAAGAIAEVSRRGRYAYEVPEQLAGIQAYARRAQGM
jgi:atypical dual specificity phosphatase